MNSTSTTTTELKLGLPRRPRSPSLPIMNPKLMTPVLGERPKLRQIHSKTASFDMGRNRSSVRSILGGSNDSAPILPDRSVESMNSPNKLPRPVMRNTRSAVFRAAERGYNDVLPTMSASTPQLPLHEPLRARARSTSGNMIQRPYGSSSALITSDQLQSSANTIRSRRKTSSYRYDENASHKSDDRSIDFGLELCEEEPENGLQQHFNSRPPNTIFSDDHPMVDDHENDEMSLGASKKIAASRSFLPYNGKFLSKLRNADHVLWLHMKPQQFMTLMLLLAIACFVASSYWEVLAATDMIETVRIEESKLLVHVHKVQQQALQLAENMKRIKDLNDGAGGAILHKEPEGNSGSEDAAKEVDGDLIRIQIDKLRDMEAELDHEVRALRKKIQQSAKEELVKHYGEGAIQVFIEMDAVADGEDKDIPSLLKQKNTVAMRLWYDTPHTGWTFLQQVEKGVWNEAVLNLDHGRALSADPNIAEGAPLRPNLDFLEPSDRGHDRYTVTLTDNNLLINLQDNKKIHQTSEACVGVIFEGFDVLHTIVREAATKTVRIKKISASHMTRAEAGGLF